MEKMSAEEQRRNWHASDTDTITEAQDQAPELAQMICCPCFNYARTNARLASALNGQSGSQTPKIGFCSTECVQFSLCIPFYGIMVAKLQGTVRAFYGIEGTLSGDWADGCCCPCATIARNEEEIVFREKYHQKVKGFQVCNLGDQTTASEYRAQVPMSYGSPQPDTTPQIASPPRAKSATYNNKDSETDLEALEPIPESAATAIPSPLLKARNAAARPEKKKGFGSVDSPEIPPVDEKAVVSSPFSPVIESFPLMQYLGQKWYLVPAEKDENTNPVEEKNQLGLDDEPKRDKTKPRASLEQDGPKARSGNILDQGKSQPAPYYPRSSLDRESHQTAQDHSSSQGKQQDERPTARTHSLNQDKQQGEPPAVRTHSLDQDTQQGDPPAVHSHTLEEERYQRDETHPRDPLDQETHGSAQPPLLNQNQQDTSEDTSKQQKLGRKLDGPLKPVIEHSKSRFTEHLLEDDYFFPGQPARSGSPHFLSADAMVSRIHALGSPHLLEDEPNAQRGRVTNNDEAATTQKGSNQTNEEEAATKKGPSTNTDEPAMQKDSVKSKNESTMRKGLKGLMMGKNERKTSETNNNDDSTPRKGSVMSNAREVGLPEETEGTWVRGFWPGAFSSTSQPAIVSHDIDDDVRVATRLGAHSPHTLDRDQGQRAPIELAEATEGGDNIVGSNTPAEVIDDKPAEMTGNKSTKATGSKIAKAASQLFGSGNK